MENALSEERITRRRYVRKLRAVRIERQRLEEQLTRTVDSYERQVELIWMQDGWAELELASAYRALAWAARPLWRKLLRRPPARS